jgi:hypothetical protein
VKVQPGAPGRFAVPEAWTVTVVGVLSTPLAVPVIGTFTMQTAVNVPDIVVDVCDETCHLKKLHVFGSRNGISSGDAHVPIIEGPAAPPPPPDEGVGAFGFASRLDFRSYEQALPAMTIRKTRSVARAYFMRSLFLVTESLSTLSESRSWYFSPAPDGEPIPCRALTWPKERDVPAGEA